MGTAKPHDLLSLCVNGNGMAKMLEESAEETRVAASSPSYLNATPSAWAERLKLQAQIKDGAARKLREIVAEIDRLRTGELS